jgi:hypothetical protein
LPFGLSLACVAMKVRSYPIASACAQILNTLLRIAIRRQYSLSIHLLHG